MSMQTNCEGDGFPGDLLVDLRQGKVRGLRERLEHGLRTAIQQERVPAGTALPPTRVLAAELGISRSVVVEAYKNLAADGYLEARQGAWTRVRPHTHQEIAARTRYSQDGDAAFFQRPRRTALLRAPFRLLGGLPDPALFPRTDWVRHYRAALAELPNAQLTYPDILGAHELRFALTAYLGRVRGVATNQEQIVVCGGVTQALTLLCRALQRAGARRIAVEDPCFGLHRMAIAMTGLEPVPIPVDANGLDPARLAGRDVAAVLVAPAHSFPLGATLTAPRRRELVAWAQQHDALIIEDDYDAEFRYDRTPIGALQGLAPAQVVYVGSASKTVTPALRLGWVVAPPELVDALVREKHFDDMGSSLLEQLAYARFIDSGDLSRYLRRVRPIYRDRRDTTIAALDELLPAARWQGAAAGLHLHVGLPADVDERALTLAAYARGVLVEDGSWHWASPEHAPPSIMIGYGSMTKPSIRQAISILADAMSATSQGRR
jgi:GntR family transcriptional regulator/MocR family aminotransferase